MRYEWTISMWGVMGITFSILAIVSFFKGLSFEHIGLLMVMGVVCAIKNDTMQIKKEISRGKVWFDNE